MTTNENQYINITNKIYKHKIILFKLGILH